MALYASEPKGDGNFNPAPEGNHQGVCVDVVNLGLMEETWEGKTSIKHKCRLIWEINEVDEETGRRFTVAKKYTVSLHKNAALRRDLKNWRGKDFTAAELERFNVESVLGANCLLNIVHNTGSNGQTYANVDAVTPLPKGMEKISVSSDFTRVKDRDGYTEPNMDPDKVASGDGRQGAAPAAAQVTPAVDDDDNLPF